MSVLIKYQRQSEGCFTGREYENAAREKQRRHPPQPRGPVGWLREGRNNMRPAQRHVTSGGQGLAGRRHLLVLCAAVTTRPSCTVSSSQITYSAWCTWDAGVGRDCAHYIQRSKEGMNPTPNLLDPSCGQRENSANLSPSSNLGCPRLGEEASS